VPIDKCWICGGSPAPWKVLAEKQGEPAVQVVFWACERCIPFAYEERAETKVAS
jgi:hypothetical protein